MAEFCPSEALGRSLAGHAENLAGGKGTPDEGRHLHRQSGVGQQVADVVAAAAAGAEPDGDPGREKLRDRGDAPAHGQIAAGGVRGGYPGPGETCDLIRRHGAEMGEGHVGGQPAPVLEQVERAAAVAFERDHDVDLLVGLSAAAEAVPRGHLGQKLEGELAVAVHPGGADRHL